MSSRRVPGVYPSAGSCPIADRIRKRRGASGLLPLDGILLHVPPIADGWSKLLGTIRTEGKLPADVRELMILRVAALNGAAFEWIHHEHVGRDAGLTTPQLAVIRDISNPVSPLGPLTPLQTAALAFADESTRDIKVSNKVFDALANELKALGHGVHDLLVEAATIVASYNMVSRFLVSLDVAGKSDVPVPWPFDQKEHTIPIPQTSQTLHAVTLVVSPTAPWLVFSNPLLANTDLWSYVTPTLTSHGYNILLFDQRGHGKSSVPGPPYCTMSELADDIALLIDYLCENKKAHTLIGVGQGGAAALQFAIRHPESVGRVIACDTQIKSSEANSQIWEDGIGLAKKDGMHAFAIATSRPSVSPGPAYHPSTPPHSESRTNTFLEVLGFEGSARVLQNYDLLSDGLLQCKVKTLLAAGENDSVLSKELQDLREEWVKEGGDVRFVEVAGMGHLPMVDCVDGWLEVVVDFLQEE